LSASSGSRASKKPIASIAKTSKKRQRKSASRSSSGSAKRGSKTLFLNEDWNEFLRVLTSTGTRYLLIGGHALAVHAEPRFTEDLDVFVEPSLSNARKLRSALVEFGFGSVIPEAAELAKPGLVWMLGRKPRRIDILTGISGVTFVEAEQGSVEVTVVDARVPVIGRDALVRNKLASARPKDLADVAMLTKPSGGVKRRRKPRQ
jgi:hypothetical protein